MSRAEEKATEYANSVMLSVNHRGDVRDAFWDGYEQAEKELGWHSVDESLPEVDKEVIVLEDILVEGSLKVGFGKIAFGHIVDKTRCVDYNGWNIPGVKFWMPCPEIPNND